MTASTRKRVGAFSLVELLVCVAAVWVLAFVFWPFPGRRRHCSCRISCANNLKQISTTFYCCAIDDSGRFPMQIATTDGGTRELVGLGKAYPHFMVLSNVLSTPKVLICPEEKPGARQLATTFSLPPPGSGQIPFTNDVNLSYFIGLDAVPDNPAAFLSGDRHLTNAAGPTRPVLLLSSNQKLSWCPPVHSGAGNIALADGSVQGGSNAWLQRTVQAMGTNKNRLALP